MHVHGAPAFERLSQHVSVMQAGLAGMLGMAGSANVQGEDQKKLDILANDVFISLLTVSTLPTQICAFEL